MSSRAINTELKLSARMSHLIKKEPANKSYEHKSRIRQARDRDETNESYHMKREQSPEGLQFPNRILFSLTPKGPLHFSHFGTAPGNGSINVQGLGSVPTGPRSQHHSATGPFSHTADIKYHQARPSGCASGSKKTTNFKRSYDADHPTYPPTNAHSSVGVASADGFFPKRRKTDRNTYDRKGKTVHVSTPKETHHDSHSLWTELGRRPTPLRDRDGIKRQHISPVARIKSEHVPSGADNGDFDASEVIPDLQARLAEIEEELRNTRKANSVPSGFRSNALAEKDPTIGKIKQEERSQGPVFPSEDHQSSQSASFLRRGEKGEVDPGLLSDNGSSGPLASPPGTPDPQESGVCQCPISLLCPGRRCHLIDCRKLVLERKRWVVSAQAQFNATLALAVPPDIADFTTVARIRDMLWYYTRVQKHPAGHASDRDSYKRMITWAAEMQTHSITQADLAVTQIVPQLKNFITPVNRNHHRQKYTPPNLLEELRFLVFKWARGDLLADAHRGIIHEMRNGRLVQRMDPNWTNHLGRPLKLSDKFYGNGHLINGQRWQTRFQMSRDGAHGAPQAGICGSKKEGARSIVMGYHDEKRHEFYADIDKGPVIYYMGTAQSPLKIVNDPEPKETNVRDTAASTNRADRPPTDGTLALMKSCETRTPVRVFRSHKLADIVAHKPRDGYRYDGLYRVNSYIELKKDRQIYRFKMTRLPGQGPLRGMARRTRLRAPKR